MGVAILSSFIYLLTFLSNVHFTPPRAEKILNCCEPASNRNFQSPNHETILPSNQENPKPKPKEEILLQIPGSIAHLIEDAEPLELAKGDFTVVRLTEENVILAIIVRIGSDLQWPLTKDEAVVKLDQLHYLFSLPSQDGEILSYAISFSEPNGSFALLDSFLPENSCFSTPASTSFNSTDTTSSLDSHGLYWKDFAPRIEDYNGVLAKTIAEGTGEIVKGIFKCTNAYIKQVQKGGEMIRAGAAEGRNRSSTTEGSKISKSKAGEKKSRLQKAMKRVRKLSKMTEKLSQSLLNRVKLVTGSVTAQLLRSKSGKEFQALVPREVLVASLDAFNKIMDAMEAAEKEAFTATSGTATTIVSERFGESAGEVTEDAFATARHVVGTAWNIFKIRKVINQASFLPSAIVKTAAKKKP
ncbi:senescence/dehydration-associated protein At4g35985, chloroplastic-like [Magnolia sinica]|uniref:senescence/dehydration-associated protein At4g35985, chloroplastic-like n=1 Tax=Magnolia sinica TaxID=86752 RepID=UPI002658898F|nr:senescence/dehydration-associated protein At4g35985, chloroplastic-like [Magnolia sinica]